MNWLQSLFLYLREWEWIGILIARVAVGLLFFLSGRGKLFVAERREQMRQTLVEAHVPVPAFNAIFVSTVEFVFGFCLLIGFLTPLASAMLCGVMVVAILTTAIKRIETSSPLAWIAEFLYLPEVLYLVILCWLFLSGPGWVSVDRWTLSRA